MYCDPSCRLSLTFLFKDMRLSIFSFCWKKKTWMQSKSNKVKMPLPAWFTTNLNAATKLQLLCFPPWLPVAPCIQFKAIILVYKALKKQPQATLENLFGSTAALSRQSLSYCSSTKNWRKTEGSFKKNLGPKWGLVCSNILDGLHLQKMI